MKNKSKPSSAEGHVASEWVGRGGGEVEGVSGGGKVRRAYKSYRKALANSMLPRRAYKSYRTAPANSMLPR